MASPTGLACSGLALICGSIASNALLLQAGRHPSPLFSTRHEEEADPQAVQGDLIVEAVQHSLRSAGFYDGPVDGVAGPRTHAAILEFERQAVGCQWSVRPSAVIDSARRILGGAAAAPAVRTQNPAADMPPPTQG
jgi:peptidoglycan hydrolase-like protein with peptidoglycan-binding domain